MTNSIKLKQPDEKGTIFSLTDRSLIIRNENDFITTVIYKEDALKLAEFIQEHCKSEVRTIEQTKQDRAHGY